MADDFTLPSRQRVINLINQDNADAGITLSQVTLSVPVTVDQYGRNTRVTLSSVSGAGVVGQRTIYYNRLDMAQFFAAVDYTVDPDHPPILGTDVAVQIEDPQSSQDLIAPILAQLGVNLSDNDLIIEPAALGVYTLKARSNSYGWYGQVPVTVMLPVIQLPAAITTLALSAFTTADITVSSKQQMVDAINADNGLTLTLNDVVFATPTVIPPIDRDVDGRDTSIVVSAKPGSRYSGSVTLTYKRLDVEAIYPSGFAIGGAWTDHNDTVAVLATLATQHNVALRNNEITNSAIADSATEVSLLIAAGSEVWQPGSALLVDLAAVPLNRVLTNLSMNGFVFTGETPAYAIADPMYDSLDQLRLLINGENSVVLGNTDLSFGVPQAIAEDGFGRNTTILVTAGVTSQYTGNVTVTYRRIDIGAFFNNVGLTLTGSMAGIATVADVVARINTQFGYALRADEFVSGAVVVNDTAWTLTVASASEQWKPGSTLVVDYPHPVVGAGNFFTLDGGEEFILDDGNSFELDG